MELATCALMCVQMAAGTLLAAAGLEKDEATGTQQQ